MNVKKVLLLCLFLAGILAFSVPSPVQSQGGLTNPTTVSSCGLPSLQSQFNTSATLTTFTLSSDCDFNSLPGGSGAFFIVRNTTITIDGGGHSITNLARPLISAGTSGTVNLNNVHIDSVGVAGGPLIAAISGGGVNLSNVIISNSTGINLISAGITSTIAITNLVARDNTLDRAAISTNDLGLVIASYGTITLNGGIFLRNTATGTGIRLGGILLRAGAASGFTVTGCLTFSGNTQNSAAGTIIAAADTRIIDSAPAISGVSGAATCSGTLFSYWLALTPQKKSKKTATPRPSATARPLATTCIDLNLATDIVVYATYGLNSGIQCQRLNGGGIGVQALADNYIDAVDVWGYVEQGVEVCFPQAGELLFLDASMMPRAAAPLASTVVNGVTCGAIDSPGSIVLMPAGLAG